MLAEVCEIKPPKSEVRGRLRDSDLVSFVPMEDLGINQKFLEPKSERKFGQVVGSYTYFADGDVLLAKKVRLASKTESLESRKA
jgi:type I restriction enzyme S subunit